MPLYAAASLFPQLFVVTCSSVLNAILQAYHPQLALQVFLALLPMLLTMLSAAEPSKSHIQRAASGKYFYFMVFNVFLGVTLSGTLFQLLQQVIKSPTTIVNLLGSALPQQSTFFISFIALK